MTDPLKVSDRAAPHDPWGKRYAFPVEESSGILIVAGSPHIVLARPGILRAVYVYTNGAADVTVTVYDHATLATGKVLSKPIVLGADLWGGEVNISRRAHNGLVIEIVGAGSSALVAYIE